MPVVKVSPCGIYRLLNIAPVQVSNKTSDSFTSTGYPVVVVVVVDEEVVDVVEQSHPVDP